MDRVLCLSHPEIKTFSILHHSSLEVVLFRESHWHTDTADGEQQVDRKTVIYRTSMGSAAFLCTLDLR